MEPDELDATIDVTCVGFGVGPVAPTDYRAMLTAIHEPGRTLVVTEGDRIVGTAAAYALDVALPGGGSAPLAGVTEAAVLPSHRRRGVLSALIDALHAGALDRGDPLAGLTASEGSIYRRFGYGVASRFQSLRLDAARARELDDPGPGPIRLVTEAEAASVLPAVWDRHWRRTAGEVSRTAGWWDAAALDIEVERDGASARFLAVHGPDGDPDGFLVYRVSQNWSAGGSRHELRIEDLAAADDQVEAALLRYAVAVDLVTTVTWQAAPPDLPLRWRLVEPRSLEVTAERDLLWLRPLDVAACLTARGYAAEGDLVIEVADDRRPPTAGRFLLDAGPDGAACARTDRTSDVSLQVPELGALLAGGVTWTTLARAGLVTEETPGALARADRMFQTPRAAWCATGF
jgi:predicted acetyltransferase